MPYNKNNKYNTNFFQPLVTGLQRPDWSVYWGCAKPDTISPPRHWAGMLQQPWTSPVDTASAFHGAAVLLHGDSHVEMHATPDYRRWSASSGIVY